LAAEDFVEPEEQVQHDESIQHEEPNRFPATFIAGLVVIAIIAGIIVALTHFVKTPQQAVAAPLPFTAAEQSYAPQIHFTDLQLSQSDNLINQHFTYIAGIVSNDGPKPVAAIEVLVEFHDQFKQVVLKDTLRPIKRSDTPLNVGEKREFNLAIDQGLPSTWDQQYPSIHVTGLVLQ
jgi:hypothetical protein